MITIVFYLPVHANSYKDTQRDNLQIYIKAMIESNHLDPQVTKRLQELLTTAEDQIDDAKTDAEVDRIVTNTETIANSYLTGGQSKTASFLALYNTYSTPSAKYGEPVLIALPLVNYADSPIYNVVVKAEISSKVSEWPFVPDAAGQIQTVRAFPAYENKTGQNAVDMTATRQDIGFVFTVREDVKTGYYPLKFSFVYTRNGTEESGELITYIYIQGKSENGKLEDDDETKSQPRIIVTGFETDPKDVRAGTDFKVVIHVQNTSKDQTVTNVLFNLEAVVEGNDKTDTYAAFLPTSGSSSIYVDSIGPKNTCDLNIELNAKADLAQKPYVLDVKMTYDCQDQMNLTDTASVSIPIWQDSRCETGDAEITPSEINVGDQCNIIFGVYNTGKTTLYNTWVKFKADSITGGDTFLGNLSPGATGNCDAMVTGAAATTDDGTIIAEVSFENEKGEIQTVEKKLNLFVSEAFNPEDFDFGIDEGLTGDGSDLDGTGGNGLTKTQMTGLGVVGGIVLLIIVIVIIRKQKARKQKKKEAEELEAEIEAYENAQAKLDVMEKTEQALEEQQQPFKSDDANSYESQNNTQD
ncbi:MAG: hypothetical protein IJU50_05785 [Lachnospiraceae bacterium]|nr:hypothetical protein [Lachnospiraceae bacterium]